MTGLRIAIIGAGPSGVVALTKFLLEKRFSLVKAFERSSNVGGAWNYNPEHGPNRKKPRVVPSTDPTCRDERTRISDPDRTDHDPLWSWSTVMYAELNTNIPGPLMAFQDAPFPPGTDLFPNRETVLSYLVDYAENVREHIAFNREVISVRKEQSGDVWTVQSRSSCTTSASDMQTEQFDRILIATGHYETPKLPDIPGIRSFNAQFPDVIRHSKYYTTPDDYAGKSVLVVGGGPSATDITDQIARVTPRARLVRSKRSAIKQAMLLYDQTVEEVGEIKQMSADGTIEFNDGNTLRDVDRILFCTGYLYSFAFLDQSSLDLDRPLVTDGERLRSLYEHLFYIPDPTLAVLAMGMNIVPFCIAEAQACYVSRVWADKLQLPSVKAMLDWERRLIATKGDSRQAMALPHPEDGHYIENLRKLCIDADGSSRVSMPCLPVDWFNTNRFELRQDTKRLKLEWLKRRKHIPEPV